MYATDPFNPVTDADVADAATDSDGPGFPPLNAVTTYPSNVDPGAVAADHDTVAAFAPACADNPVTAVGRPCPDAAI